MLSVTKDFFNLPDLLSVRSYLFGDGRDLQTFLEHNDAYSRQARLTLCLHPDASALRGLPWEYLHDGQAFVCPSGRLLLHRKPLGLGELRPAQTAPPLRILVVISLSQDQAGERGSCQRIRGAD